MPYAVRADLITQFIPTTFLCKDCACQYLLTPMNVFVYSAGLLLHVFVFTAR